MPKEEFLGFIKNMRAFRSTPKISPPTFELFGKLPPEIRHHVWHLAACDPTNAESGVCIFKRTNVRLEAESRPDEPLVVPDRRSALLRTTSESRAIALKLKKEREFHPARDILYVSSEDFDTFTTGCWFNKTYVPPWAAELKVLALGQPYATRHQSLPAALPFLPKLTSIYVVFPRSRGVMDLDLRVEPSKEQLDQPKIRKLTYKESNRLTLNADFIQETWASIDRVRYTTNATKHVAGALKHLEHMVRNQESHPPYWNAQTRKLSLNFEAACFVGT